MNIFFLSMSIIRCSQAHFDKHVIKMILEYCQLLSTCWHLTNPIQGQKYLENDQIYRKTHIHHPCVKWLLLHYNNYDYVVKLGLALCKEWRYRYKHEKIHGCEPKLLFLYDNRPNLPNHEIIKTSHNPKCLQLPLPQAMPIKYKKKDSVHGCVRAYRRYYKSSCKSHLVNWKGRDKPLWW